MQAEGYLLMLSYVLLNFGDKVFKIILVNQGSKIR